MVPGYFDLELTHNPGAFFSLGADLDESIRRPLFLVLTLVAIALLVRLYFRARSATTRLRVSLSFFVAGATGNLVDRVLGGEVVDFMHVHFQERWHWATFNFADTFISVGLGLLLAELVRPSRPVANEAVDERRPID